MTTRAIVLGIAALLGPGCIADPLEGAGNAAVEGTRVEVMLVPLDQGATVSDGAAAFDDGVSTTDSLDELVRGDGVYVVGVADGWGIALVPAGLTDDATNAADGAPAGDEDGLPRDDEGAIPRDDEDPRDDDQDARYDDEGDAGSCAADCDEWCATVLDLCEGDGAVSCDCYAADEYEGDDADDLDEQGDAACAADCDEWCATTLDLCGGDGYVECSCADVDDGYDEPEEEPACAWDCTEWCDGALDLCDGDGWELCADSCDYAEAGALPPSASAGGWVAPLVVGGVALVIVMTDPQVQAALDRGESIGSAVGGTYGRRAEEIMRRLRQLRDDVGELTADARRPCADLLARRGYSERATFAAGDSIRVGICMQDVLTVWPRDLTIRAGGQGTADVTFANLGSGFRTVTSRDATVGWTEAGEDRSVVVSEGGGTVVTLPLGAGSFRLSVAVPRDDSATNVAVTVAR